MVYFGKYLKDYLEFYKISQSDFAIRMGISQKHMNELLNGKTNITAEVAANIERLTGINIGFILNIENSRKIKENIISQYGNEENIRKNIIEKYYFKELKKNGWVNFKDETDNLQICIDLLDFLKIKDFSIVPKLQNQVLFKKSGEDFNRLALWIAHCDEIVKEQEVEEYNSCNLLFLIEDLNKFAYNNKNINLEEIRKILNQYGIYFACEKAIPGTKVRGCFKVRGNKPTIYITDNYAGKDSLFFELYHELGHCKSDYNVGKNKVVIDGSEEKEKRADKFALEMMIKEEIWKEIIQGELVEKRLQEISKIEEIPMCFIVGRLARMKLIKYNSKLYCDNFRK